MSNKKNKALRLITFNLGPSILPEEIENENENEEIKTQKIQNYDEPPAIVETIYSHQVISEGKKVYYNFFWIY